MRLSVTDNITHENLTLFNSKKYGLLVWGKEILIEDCIKTSDQVLVDGSIYKITPLYSNPYPDCQLLSAKHHLAYLGTMFRDLNKLKGLIAQDTASIEINSNVYTGKLICFDAKTKIITVDGKEMNDHKIVIEERITVPKGTVCGDVGIKMSNAQSILFAAQPGSRIETSITVEEGAKCGHVGLSLGNIEFK